MIFAGQSVNKDNSRNENKGYSWNITQYLLSETDAKYIKRHALSQALKGWKRDVVSDFSVQCSKNSLLITCLEARNSQDRQIERCRTPSTSKPANRED